MGKRVILYLFLLFSLSLQAQSEEKALSTNDSTRIDSTTVTQSSPFKRAIKKFMNFSDFDTLYISPNRYNYALMATHSATSNITLSPANSLNHKNLVSLPTRIIK